MSAFSSLSGFFQTLIPLLLFLEAVLESVLFIYRISHRRKSLGSLPSFAIFVFLITLLLSVTQGDPFKGKDAFLSDAPTLIFITAILLVFVHLCFALPKEYLRRKNEISPFSVKEATDKLPMGLCYADPDGRIILCNVLMRRLSFALSGHELQIAGDFEKALEQPDKSITVNGDCYILPDKTVWQFRKQNITVDNDDNWLQMTAHNVTELYNGNVRQAVINDELKQVNRKLHKMYERMADDIKEKESLDLKIHIHDTIGRSLLTIHDIIESDENTDKKLETLQEAIAVLTSDRVTADGTMDEVIQTAKTLGVTVTANGYLPPDSLAEELTVAAARECVTNCIKHAGGNEVYICIFERMNLYDITITNNGAVPSEPIKEGSGLSSLRRSIESAGGEMHTAYKPRFALLLTLPEKEIDI
ncbi:MAG: ATP-binding protein [Oscillospiraceae bacterium]|nr:ATP-binding protein [Oscillospiraceae bacterium]